MRIYGKCLVLSCSILGILAFGTKAQKPVSFGVSEIKPLTSAAPAGGVKEISRKQSEVSAGVQLPNNSSLMTTTLKVPGQIVTPIGFACAGPQSACEHVHGCTIAICQHEEYDIQGDGAVWWAFTDDGNDKLFTWKITYR
jgi:hypothetical protein